MILNLSDLADEPLQSQIIRQLRAQILAGDLEAGTALPSIRQMARDQKISVITVQRAYENLILQNLIHSRRGKGFFVSEMASRHKKEMAFEHLEENILKPLKAAKAEGLENDDIIKTIEKLLKNLK